VRDLDGGKVLLPERHQAIEKKLKLAIAELDKR
jgi:hypothetical protein